MLTNILQPTHLIVLLVVVLLILGPKRLPEAGRALGHGLNEFKNSISGTPDANAEEAQNHSARHGVDRSLHIGHSPPDGDAS